MISKACFLTGSEIRKQILKDLREVLAKLKISLAKLSLEHPAEPSFGDYSTNIALRIKKRDFSNPIDLANHIVNTWRLVGLPDYLAKVEVVKPGFINLWLKQELLSTELAEVLKRKGRYGSSLKLKGKKILLEHTSPNPQTTIMLGHLRNNFLGMAVANIFEFTGANVTRDCVVNDRGVHICKAIWGFLVFGRKNAGLKKSQLLDFKKISDSQIRRISTKVDWQKLLGEWIKKKSGWLVPAELKLKPDHANLIWYVLGSRAYDLSEEIKKQTEEMLISWEAGEKGIQAVWKQILDWSRKGYSFTYKRVGSIHDWVWYESGHYKQGKGIVEDGLKKKVFKISEGAVVTDLAKYGLPDTIVQKSDGTALYITQDLALVRLKCQKFSSDLYIWDIGEEQTLYFKQLFTVCEQLGIGKRDKFFHLAYALINFKGGGKMATRRGDVVMADEILNELHQRVMEIIKSSNQELRGRLSKRQLEEIAEKVGLGAIKYSLLKFNRETTIYFDIDESLSLEGDSGPYLQYTYARCQSVLKKAADSWLASRRSWKPTPEELALLRTIYRFPEVVEEAAQNFAPNLICNFLFDLAQKYNLFYNRLPILKSAKGVRESRLALTAATAQILKNGLTLLGIEVLERM